MSKVDREASAYRREEAAKVPQTAARANIPRLWHARLKSDDAHGHTDVLLDGGMTRLRKPVDREGTAQKCA
jgi:hypothetical protein